MLHVIYVPGLGDSRPYGQKGITWFWRLFGLKVHYFPLGWADGEAYAPKFKRLLAKIDSFDKVALVGVSAGASAVLNAYSVRPNLVGVVCISGKIQNPQTIHPRRFEINPAFKDSVFGVQDNLKKLKPSERHRIMSIHPLYDQTVPIKDTIVSGAVERVVHVRGHITSIYYTIIFKAPTIYRFLKNT